MNVGKRGLRRTVGREAEVHGHRGGVGDDVAGNAAVDAHRRQSFAVGAAVDLDAASLIIGQPVQHGAQFVNRVVAQP